MLMCAVWMFPKKLCMHAKRFNCGNCDFIVADGQVLPLRGKSFDVVYSSDVFGHILDLKKGINEVYRVLKNGGRAIVFSETSGQSGIRKKIIKVLGFDPWFQLDGHISLYPFSELMDLLKNTFVIEEYKFFPDHYGILVRGWDPRLDEFPELRKHFKSYRYWGKAVQFLLSVPLVKSFLDLLYASMIYFLIKVSHKDKAGVFIHAQKVAPDTCVRAIG